MNLTILSFGSIFNKNTDANDIPAINESQQWPQSQRLKNRSKFTNPQKAHLHPEGCVWQYKNNPTNAFRAIVRKMNLLSAIK